MILAFYKVDNSKGYDRRSFYCHRPETIIDVLKDLKDDEVRIFDTEHYGWGTEPSPNLADFEEMYNDEELDGGWWCIVINIKEAPNSIQYLGCEVYQIETGRDGTKQIHIDGYCYWNDDEYQLVQGTFCYVDVKDAMKDVSLCEKAFDETKQYQYDVTVEDVIRYYKNPKPLAFEDVNEDTPDGLYVNA